MKKNHAPAMNPSVASGSGFTLIELLVVISIIALLSVLTFAVFQSAREKARAAQIISDIKNIETAMHLYMDSNNYSVWPRQFGPGCAVCGAASTCGTVCGNPACICMPTDNKYTDLVPDFLPAVPVPPLTGAFYIYENAGDRYPDVDETFAGVNIRINGISHEDSLTYFAILDEIIDDSDGQDTGKLRRKDDNDRICYLISPGEDEY